MRSVCESCVTRGKVLRELWRSAWRGGAPSPRAIPPPQPAQDATPYGPQSGYPGYRPSNAATPYEGVAIRFVAILIDTIIIGVISSILTAPFFALSITRLATRAISPADTHATRLAGPRYWNHKQATM